MLIDRDNVYLLQFIFCVSLSICLPVILSDPESLTVVQVKEIRLSLYIGEGGGGCVRANQLAYLVQEMRFIKFSVSL